MVTKWFFSRCHAPFSRPYISKAICQSGTSLMEWAIQTDPVGKTRRLAAAVGCPETETKSQADILEYLRGQSTAALYSKMLPTLDTDERRRGLPIPFKPCLERDEVRITARSFLFVKNLFTKKQQNLCSLVPFWLDQFWSYWRIRRPLRCR